MTTPSLGRVGRFAAAHGRQVSPSGRAGHPHLSAASAVKQTQAAWPALRPPDAVGPSQGPRSRGEGRARPSEAADAVCPALGKHAPSNGRRERSATAPAPSRPRAAPRAAFLPAPGHTAMPGGTLDLAFLFRGSVRLFFVFCRNSDSSALESPLHFCFPYRLLKSNAR